MSREELSPQAAAFVLLCLVIGVPAGLLIVAARWPVLLGPVLAGVVGTGSVVIGRFVRRQLREAREPEPWREGLPPWTPPDAPALTSPAPSPPPSSSGPVGRCPFDDEALPAFVRAGDVVDERDPTEHWRCRCGADVLAPGLFSATLERYGLDREVVLGVAELHPSPRGCPLCARRMAAPPLRDTRPLVCLGCGAAAFAPGALPVFRGEARRGGPDGPIPLMDDGAVDVSDRRGS